MANYLSDVLMGNVVFHPEVLRECLKKFSYHMIYRPEEEKVEFSMNNGGGGRTLFEVRNVPYESAKKLAEGLGLIGSDSSLFWSKNNPYLKLYDDGSEGAKKLKEEIMTLGIPFRVVEREEYGFGDWGRDFLSHGWTLEMLLKEVRGIAMRYAGELGTTP